MLHLSEVSSIHRVSGSVATAHGSGPRILVEVVSDSRGLRILQSSPLCARWPVVLDEFRQWHQSADPPKLGAVQLVRVDTDLWVGTLVCVASVILGDQDVLRYGALSSCLKKLATLARRRSAEVYLDRRSFVIFGGDWARIQPIVQEALCAQGIAVSLFE